MYRDVVEEESLDFLLSEISPRPAGFVVLDNKFLLFSEGENMAFKVQNKCS